MLGLPMLLGLGLRLRSLSLAPLGLLPLRVLSVLLPLGLLPLRLLSVLFVRSLRLLALRLLSVFLRPLGLLALRLLSALFVRPLRLRALRLLPPLSLGGTPLCAGIPQVSEELQALVGESLVDGGVLLWSGPTALLRWGRVGSAAGSRAARPTLRPMGGVGTAPKPERFAPLSLVAVRVVDDLEHRRRVRAALFHPKFAAQARLGGQQVPLVEAPHLLGIWEATRGGDVAREEAVEVVDVAD